MIPVEKNDALMKSDSLLLGRMTGNVTSPLYCIAALETIPHIWQFVSLIAC